MVSVKPKTVARQVPIEGSGFLVFLLIAGGFCVLQNSITRGTAFSRQRKNIEAKSQFSCE
jgi:hypothetical protein